MTPRRSLTTTLALAVALGAPAVPALAAPATAATAPADEDQTALLQQLAELVPDETPRLDALNASLGIDPQQLIDGSQFECSQTELQLWIDDQVADWTVSDRAFLSSLQVLNWPSYEALLFQPDGPQHYGVSGEYTRELEKTFRTLQDFWDVDHVQLAAMHSDVIMDDSRMVPMVAFLFGTGQAQTQLIVDTVQSYLGAERFDFGAHPAFTFNAFAYSDGSNGAATGIPDKIIMGDGVLTGMEAVGLGDVAPRGILAHEFGHHLQYELDLMAGYGVTPEKTRELELEADALAGYYLSHPRGERLRQQRVEAFVASFGQTGDCGFASPSHHGTPSQRIASARWSDELANAKGAKGQILPAQTVSDRFRAVLPEILAPDA